MSLITVKLNLIKKNRIYFACKTETGYEVKLRITEASKDLPLGEHELLVEDASVRTKYGTDIIYVLHSAVNSNSKIILKSQFNYWLVNKCKKLGGKWDSEDKVWVFSDVVKDEVEELDFIYNSELVSIELTAAKNLQSICDSISFLGYDIVTATGRDSGAVPCDGVSFMSGEISSGGSHANWQTFMEAGTKVRLKVPVELLNSKSDSDFIVERI